MLVSMSRIIFPAVMFTAIAAAAALVDYRSSADEMPTSHDIGVTQAVSAPGIVEGATEEIALSPEVSGTLVERLVSVGDHVQKGQPLLRLDDRTARLNVKAAEAELASAIAQRDRLVNGARPQEREEARALQRAAASRLALAMTSLTRIEQLESHRAVPEQEADDARSGVETLRADLAAANARVALIEAPAREDELRLADARVAAANAAVEAARVALDKTTLSAPCDAQVLDIDAEIGELLTPASATSVAVLSDTRRLRVRAFVEELDAPRVTVGSKVTFIADGLPGRTFEGVVASLSPRMAAKQLFSGAPNEIYDTKTREVLVDVADGEGLLIGLRVDVTLQLAGAPPR